MSKKSFLLLFVVSFISLEAESVINKKIIATHGKDGTTYITYGKNILNVLQTGFGSRVIIGAAGRFTLCKAGRCGPRVLSLGSKRNPAKSCSAIFQKNRLAPSGAYYISTKPNMTKVYCYMENIPGCGGGGWTTIMKTNGHKSTFAYTSALWGNKAPYHVIGGQTGVDDQETKLPTYWTMPFKSLCLGMRTRAKTEPKWIRLSYRASSMYSVIADGRYRSTSIGRNTWKSLIPDSSLQRNCNKEGFNSHVGMQGSARIGILSNQQNDCKTPDSRIGFGTAGTGCSGRADNSVSTGNVAVGCAPDNGDKTIRAFGYILAQ